MSTLMREAFTPEERKRYAPKRVYHDYRGHMTPTKSTFWYTDEQGRKVIRYHHTDIYIEGQDTFIMSNGGWTTHSTKERLSTYTPYGYVYQKDYEWYFTNKGIVIPFTERMELPLNEVEFLNQHVPYGKFTTCSHFEYNGVSARIDDVSELPTKPEVFEVKYTYNAA